MIGVLFIIVNILILVDILLIAINYQQIDTVIVIVINFIVDNLGDIFLTIIVLFFMIYINIICIIGLNGLSLDYFILFNVNPIKKNKTNVTGFI